MMKEAFIPYCCNDKYKQWGPGPKYKQWGPDPQKFLIYYCIWNRLFYYST